MTAAPGPLLVIAGAGSGKTRTPHLSRGLLARERDRSAQYPAAHVHEQSCARKCSIAWRICCRSMPADFGAAHSTRSETGCLRRHGSALGYSSGFTIMDREDQKDLINAVVAAQELIRRRFDFRKAMCSRKFSVSSSTPRSRWRNCSRKSFLISCRYSSRFKDVHERYEKKKKATNSMDFDDLLEKTLSMFQQHERIAEFYRRQFQFILVDEYQDTNKIQADLIDLLARDHRNVMVVGDDAQSIYSWRGANFQNILEFPKRYPDAQVFKIEMNYRSVPEILRSSERGHCRQRSAVPQTLKPQRANQALTRPALVALNDGARASAVCRAANPRTAR